MKRVHWILVVSLVLAALALSSNVCFAMHIYGYNGTKDPIEDVEVSFQKITLGLVGNFFKPGGDGNNGIAGVRFPRKVTVRYSRSGENFEIEKDFSDIFPKKKRSWDKLHIYINDDNSIDIKIEDTNIERYGHGAAIYPDYNDPGYQKFLQLRDAAGRGDVDAVRRLLSEGVPFRWIDHGREQEVFSRAANAGHKDVLSVFLEYHGSDISIKDLEWAIHRALDGSKVRQRNKKGEYELIDQKPFMEVVSYLQGVIKERHAR